MFKFLSKLGGEGSPLSRMNSQQKLQALGAAFGGDQKMLGELLSGLPGQGGAEGPILNDEGQDISAGFAGVSPMGAAGQMLGGDPSSMALGLPAMLAMRKFKFGRR